MKANGVKRVLLLAAVALFSLCAGEHADAQTATVKVNWDVGTADGPFQPFHLTYHDAHLKIATRGVVEETPAPTTIDDGFDNHNVNVAHGFPDDCITIDWTDAAGLNGRNHIGAEFNVTRSPVTGNRNDVRVVESRLTGVSGMIPGGGGSFGPIPSLDVPGPQSITYRKANSAAVEFSVDNPGMIAPVMFSGVEFYKTTTEPALADLDAIDFPTLPKTFLMAVPDFSLGYGTSMAFLVPSIDVPEWLLVKYSTTWIDPTLSMLVGGPTMLTVNTWFAGEMVPEPASVVLALTGLLLTLAIRPR
jgi:hypothetical protein